MCFPWLSLHLAGEFDENPKLEVPNQQTGQIWIFRSNSAILNWFQDLGNSLSVAGFWMAALYSMVVDPVARVGFRNTVQQIPPTFHGCFW